MKPPQSHSVSTPLLRLIHGEIARQGGWLPFDRFMAMALYAPGLGYYSAPGRRFGLWPDAGSDFVTAPELSPYFARTLADQLRQAMLACRSAEIWEFGAGSGVLAGGLLDALADQLDLYHIVDVSGALRMRQRERLAPYTPRVQWHDTLPETMHGVIIGNEVLDAMPVQLLHHDGTTWHERGVTSNGAAFGWADRATALHAPFDLPVLPGTLTEIHPQAEAFIATLAARLEYGVAFFIDYGFPQAEYYHPQRVGGTLMCHRSHQSDCDPLADVGQKDITAHVNFTAIALAGQNNGLSVLGYTSQAHFLMNCGLLELLGQADLKQRANAQKLVTEHEMGELFKVIGFAKGCELDTMGFSRGDRSHTL